jgi:hypothetical protein
MHAWPAWLAQLGQLELLELTAANEQLDDGDERDAGPLRVHFSATWHMFGYDFPRWREPTPQEKRGSDQAPVARRCLLLIWRRGDGGALSFEIGRRERDVLTNLRGGGTLDGTWAQRLGMPPAELDEIVADLHGAGVLVGSRNSPLR